MPVRIRMPVPMQHYTQRVERGRNQSCCAGYCETCTLGEKHHFEMLVQVWLFSPCKGRLMAESSSKAKRAVVAERQAGAESACLPGTPLSAGSKGGGVAARGPPDVPRGGISRGRPSVRRLLTCGRGPPGQAWGRGGGGGRAPGAKPPASVSPKPGSDRRETHPRFPGGGSLLSSRQGQPLPSWPPGVCVCTRLCVHRACGHACVRAPGRGSGQKLPGEEGVPQQFTVTGTGFALLPATRKHHRRNETKYVTCRFFKRLGSRQKRTVMPQRTGDKQVSPAVASICCRREFPSETRGGETEEEPSGPRVEDTEPRRHGGHGDQRPQDRVPERRELQKASQEHLSRGPLQRATR
ncbi:uncharacterized protein LOC122475121 [Prionailurus bengalensis]|uniref:uncharacterized protein LOC122475121 n=1 Tax=Prionailurus bengalensis TaxID=37029 RepID=UPI001CA84DD6|nr:uncharacterized protein LOC122475121 [Prionailurus bengalensis]